ncbi:ribonuclease Y [Cellulomonas timonensis]|uniref:ribonuclease Y n=1 Tax=Cellulomonas timonensis TaxID=1689271 RepID=UPI001F32F4A6|nr:ribonuclease Y [Cellulomonas timonensis]
MPVPFGEIGIVVALLIVCLVALMLVLIARREAAAQREQATLDVAEIKNEARALLADAERRTARLSEREDELAAERRALKEVERELQARAAEVAALQERAAQQTSAAEQQARELLEASAGLTTDEARAELVRRTVDAATNEAAAQVRRAEAHARRTAEAKAKRIVATAVQRAAVATSAQSSITVLRLPSEEMKGRIIGKEGRNIRTFEALTGVNVLIDDTPDSVVLSCFDPERREIAQVALESLMADGRIHPQRIEAAYAEAVASADERTLAAGHDAAERAGVSGLPTELVSTMGRLRLRTSYGQNVLEHLVESALIAGAIAAEVGADIATARRAAFLHDIGKALTAEQSGAHAALGAELARRHGESPAVVNAIAAHHDDVPVETVEGVLVQAADAASAARPGARREELDQYVERMDKLEQLVTAHAGVRRALAMSAGREVRVVVEPSEVDDYALPQLAVAIAKHIEADLAYPGEIKVTVVREIRASATAG